MNDLETEVIAERVIQELTTAYWMEMETIQNYTAHASNLTGVRGQRVAHALAEDIMTELGHARMLADRIHTLGGTVPCSFKFEPKQSTLQFRQEDNEPIDIPTIVQGVIDAEEAAIAQYKALIYLCDGQDHGTQDLCTELLREEEKHRREFMDYLAEYHRETATTVASA